MSHPRSTRRDRPVPSAPSTMTRRPSRGASHASVSACSLAPAIQYAEDGAAVSRDLSNNLTGGRSRLAEFHGVPLKPAPKELQADFYKCMPDFGSPKNPVDITGGAGLEGYEKAIAIALRSD